MREEFANELYIIPEPKQDLTSYGDDELILIVDNTEFLYSIRYNENFPDFIDEGYKYTPKQWTNLVKHLQDNK